MIDRNRVSRETTDTAARDRRTSYQKPRLRLHGTLEPKLLGSPPPPPTGGMLGFRHFPWK